MIDHDKLQALREFAERKENWRDCTPRDEVPKIPGDNKKHTLKLFGSTIVTVVFSIDYDQKLGPVKHMSISMHNGKFPHPVLVQDIGKELGILEPYIHMGWLPGDPRHVIHLISKHEVSDAPEAA
jgi:hypothetical protein